MWGEEGGLRVCVCDWKTVTPPHPTHHHTTAGPATAPPTCTAQPKLHQVLEYSAAPSKQRACLVQPSLPLWACSMREGGL